jgi:AcrR family transcriptional regulator
MSPRHSAAEADRTRSAIVDTAVARASVDGLDGLTIGRLAADLRLSKAGVIGPFGSKQELQLAVLRRGAELFAELVWHPVADLPAGRTRLLATCERWYDYLASCPLPGGCLITTASVEWDTRAGPVHDAIARIQQRWLSTLAAEAEVATRARELPDRDPAQVAFELNGIAMSLNMAVQLFGEPQARDRAQRALERVLQRGA